MKHRDSLKRGFHDGIAIGLGYFAVAFSLGIVAGKAGLTAFQGFLTSLLVNASAGENAGFKAIEESVPYLQMILITLVSNARYILMSTALSQKLHPNTSILHRLLLGFYMTDEFFALAVSKEGYADPWYSYGAILFASPLWALGTAFGILFGNIMPARIVSALSVALYGMFLAIIFPPARKNRIIALLIILSFLSSYLLSRFSSFSTSTITILLTIVLSALAAFFFPQKGEDHD